MDKQQTYEALLGSWNETDADQRARIVRENLSPDFLYADPHNPDKLSTHEDFLAFLQLFQDRVADVEVQPAGFSQHKTFALAKFRIMRGAAQFASGTYALEYAEDNRIKRMIGFVDGE